MNKEVLKALLQIAYLLSKIAAAQEQAINIHGAKSSYELLSKSEDYAK